MLKENKIEIKNLKHNTSAGQDKISTKMIKYSQHVFVPHLSNIVSQILCPCTWKKVNIFPRFKYNNPLNTITYRGKTVQAYLEKLFNVIIQQQLFNAITQQQINNTNRFCKGEKRTSEEEKP